MSHDHSFDTILTELKAGDNVPFVKLFDMYSTRLKALARERIGHRLRGQGEESDILQSLWLSFDRRVKDGEFDRLSGWGELWSLLACITVRKCVDRIRYFTALSRMAPDRTGAYAIERVDGEPTSEEDAIYEEEFQGLMSRLNDRDRHILTLHLQGSDLEEIAASSGWSERTVARVLGNIREELEARAEGRPIV
jgi:RNA polymerase sigma-70 factor, ECF subfamily